MNMPILAQTINVADKQTSLIQYKSLPVMTTEQLAEFYGTDVKNIQINYLNNSSRFLNEKHCFKLEGDELRDFKNMPNVVGYVQKNAARLMLWTEKGAARHAKILDTDQAWEVFEQLEEVYFSIKEKSQSNAPALPSDYLSALKALVVSEEQKQIAMQERDHAIATKAEIGSRREATAMATASKHKREVEKLKVQLDESLSFASVKAVEIATGRKFNWHPLKKWSLANGLEIQTIPDPNFTEVKTYHKDAWLAVYNINLSSIRGA